ncbi:hypothetical protein Tco_0366942 [Tanacetum coccineum]
MVEDLSWLNLYRLNKIILNSEEWINDKMAGLYEGNEVHVLRIRRSSNTFGKIRKLRVLNDEDFNMIWFYGWQEVDDYYYLAIEQWKCDLERFVLVNNCESFSLDIPEMAQPDNNNTLSSAFKTFFEREKLTGDNFNDWYRSLRIVLRVAGTYDYLFKPCPEEPPEDAAENVKAAWKAEYKIHSDVACLMLGRMSPALQRQFELYFPQAMLDELRRMFEKPKAVEIYDLVDTLHSCKQAPGKSVSAHVLEMKGPLTRILVILLETSICIAWGRQWSDLHALLSDYEKGLKDKVLRLLLKYSRYKRVGTDNKSKPQGQKQKIGRDTGCAQAVVEAIGTFDLVLPSGLVLKLNNCYFAPSIVRGVVSFSCLLDLGFNITGCCNGISFTLNGTCPYWARLAMQSFNVEVFWKVSMRKIFSFDNANLVLSGKMTRNLLIAILKELRSTWSNSYDVCGTT